MDKLPDYLVFKNCGAGHDLRNVFTAANDDLIELLSNIFCFYPINRWNATQCLQSRYFRQEPFMCDDSELPLNFSNPEEPISHKRGLRSRSGGPPKSKRKLDFD